MKTSRTLATASLALLLSACGGGDTGHVTVLLKDAPANFDAAVVTISEVDLVGSGGTTVLSKTKTTTNLLTLANDTAKLVDGAVVPVGTYAQLRFVITGAYIDVGGAIYATSPTYEGLPTNLPQGTAIGSLTMPSFAQTGLKVDLPGGALQVGTEAKVLLVDFHVADSFGQEAGGSGGWVMHPVVQAIEVELTGTIDVTLSPGGVTLPAGTSLADFQAVLTPAAGGDSTTIALASTSGGAVGGSFKFLFPGSYTVGLVAPAGVSAFTSTPASPATVTVTSGQATAAAFTLASATP